MAVGHTRGAAALQYPAAFIVIEELIAPCASFWSRPGAESTLVVVAHGGPGLRATGTTLGATATDIATDHITHRVIAGIGIGDRTKSRRRMDVGSISIRDCSRRP